MYELGGTGYMALQCRAVAQGMGLPIVEVCGCEYHAQDVNCELVLKQGAGPEGTQHRPGDRVVDGAAV